MTRRQEEHISGTLYGELGGHDDGSAKLACSVAIGIGYGPGDDPIAIARERLQSAGYSSPEELKQSLAIPLSPMVCSAAEIPPEFQVSPKGEDFLLTALILGLCTATNYDPARPVIWTRTSLSRQLKLFTLGGFYASS
jgi:hypothetical protein